MTTRFNRRIHTMTLIGSVLLISACATLQTEETIVNRTDQATSVVIEKGKFETPPEPPANAAQAIEPSNSASVAAPKYTQLANSNATLINRQEPFVNIRTSPSTKGRIVGVLQRGEAIEVLDTKDNWVKISWHNGRAKKKGWLKKMFVEGYEQK